MNYDIFKEFSKFNNVTYYDEPHVYFIDDKQAISVTTIIGVFKPEFDYVPIMKGCVQAELRTKTESPEDIEHRIGHKWVYENKHACYEGSLIHSYMENMMCGKIVKEDTGGLAYSERREDKTYAGTVSFDEVQSTVNDMKILANKFYNTYIRSGWLIPVKSEMIVGNYDLGIAGMVDQLFYNTKTNTLQIWDWKSNKQFLHANAYEHKLLHCLSHLDECQMDEYSVQLHMYKYIIEKTTNLKLDNVCNIVWINENNDDPMVIQCRDMTAEVQLVIAFMKENPHMFKPRPYVRPVLKPSPKAMMSMANLLNFEDPCLF
jgi:hypothetical protein